jgi:hypothetical protein
MDQVHQDKTSGCPVSAGADGGAAARVGLCVPNATPMPWQPCRR